MNRRTKQEWLKLIRELGREFECHATQHDRDGSFVSENYAALREHGVLAAAIPEELGGGGVSHSTMCDLLRVLAQYCGSTALAQGVNQEIEYTLRAEGFEGVVDQSSPNGGVHIGLKTSVTKAALQEWFSSKALPFPEYFGPETKNKLGLPAFGGGPAWSLQDPAVKVRGLDGYVDLWTSLPQGPP